MSLIKTQRIIIKDDKKNGYREYCDITTCCIFEYIYSLIDKIKQFFAH